ncbi:MAG: hypothetical protein M3N43_10905, partial [Actinomycetota bacterium]|nr:hypothetical protein [Actinomycetota bacterium]
LALLALWPTGPLSAQLSWSGRLGATYTTPMVTDQVSGSVIEMRAGISPTLGLEGSYPLPGPAGLSASAELQMTAGAFERHEGGTATRVGDLRTFAFSAGLRGKLVSAVTWRAGIGIVSYLTTEETSVFQDDRPTRLLGTGALEYRRRLSPLFSLVGLLRYDVHGFTSQQLASTGYTGQQTVHRMSVGVGVAR